jgi:putative endopeptidase
MKRCVIGTILMVCLTVACAPTDTQHAPEELTAEQISSEVLSAMDLSADPCQDFYRYTCGGWLDTTEIPADQSRWSRGFDLVREKNRTLVNTILEEAAADPGDDVNKQMIGNYYAACMDEAAIDARGAAPLEPLFELIATVQDAQTLMPVMGQLNRWEAGMMFDYGVFPDFKNSDIDILHMLQGGLGMPDRDYYVSEDETKRELLRDYELHVARVFGLLGEDADVATRHAAAVVAFETELAQASLERAALRNYENMQHKIDLVGLQELTPGLPWSAYFEASGHPDAKQINVWTPDFFTTLEALVGRTEPETLQAYLRWGVTREASSTLSAEFVDAEYEFYGKKIAGQEEIRPRWKRCVDATTNALGEAVGKLYVDLTFSGDSKTIAKEMIGDLKASFDANLPGLAWMDETTAGRAREKLQAMEFKIGYPDEWRDYSSMTITTDAYFENSMAAQEFEFDRQFKKVGMPVDRQEWGMTPQTVNASNNPLLNMMTYPAGILQPPFFHQNFPAAMNYGAIGGGIGHELTHGFDDQGRKFNPQGRMIEWWEPEVAEKFEEQAGCVDDFYSAYEIEPGTSVNGKLTLGENIADIGGLKQSSQAYALREQRHGAEASIIDGVTNEQLLFIAWGQIWCAKQTPEQARLQVTTDPHSPPQFRVNGPVSHIPAFAEAFNCEPGTPLNPATRCLVW